MKHIFVFSPILVILSAIPIYILSSKSKYYGYEWFSDIGKFYLFKGAPIYVVISLVGLLFIFVAGKYVKRVESGISLVISLILTALIYLLASGLGGLASQGAGQ